MQSIAHLKPKLTPLVKTGIQRKGINGLENKSKKQRTNPNNHSDEILPRRFSIASELIAAREKISESNNEILSKFSPGFWLNKENHKNFLEELAVKLNIKKPEDWGSISKQSLHERGGSTLLRHYGSLRKALKQIFPEIEWKNEWFLNSPKVEMGFWKKKENRKQFLEELAVKLDIKEPKDWGKVSKQQILENHGGSLLVMHNSLRKALSENFPEIEWNPEWFPNAPKFESGFWNSTDNHRRFLVDLAKNLHIDNPKEWGKVTRQKIIENNGGSLLHVYKSLQKALSANFPEIEWRSEWFVHSQKFSGNFWASKENHRRFLEELAAKLEITEHKDWGKVSNQVLIENHGSSLLKIYKSLKNALTERFPEVEWKDEWFRVSHDNSYWKNKENHRKFLEQLALKLEIRKPQDWGKVSVQTVVDNQGSPLISFYKSIRKALRENFPGIEWNDDWFIKVPKVEPGFWKKKENHRKFLDQLAVKLDIKSPEDWGKVSQQTLLENHGSSLLGIYFTLRKALSVNFPETEWKKEWFVHSFKYEKGFWKSKENHKQFLDSLKTKLEIKKPQDWGKITARKFVSYDGGSLMNNYGSIMKALQSVYPDTEWKPQWFRVIRYPREYWNSTENYRKFLDKVANDFHIQTFSEWQRVSQTSIRNSGGHSLLKKHQNSLLEVLKVAYPHEPWTQLVDIKSPVHTSSNQMQVWKTIKKFFPDENILMNYRHPDLISDRSLVNVELDIWLPNLKLALEYHGIQHFRDTFSKITNDQRSRDQVRRDQCKKAGISLVEVPYWWDNDEDALLSTLLKLRPDLKAKIDPSVASDEKMNRLISDPNLGIPSSMRFKDSDFIMLSKIWNPKMDPSGWLMTEKYDGIRAYWDGFNFYNKNGNLIPCPQKFKSSLPKFPLDGELWLGRNSFHHCRTVIGSQDWSQLKLVVFDVPNHQGNFTERIDFLKQVIPKRSQNILLASFTKVQNREHLIRTLEDTIAKGGEGLMISHPNNKYTTGRSNYSLKVKPFYTEIVRVVKLEQILPRLDGMNKYSRVIVEK